MDTLTKRKDPAEFAGSVPRGSAGGAHPPVARSYHLPFRRARGVRVPNREPLFWIEAPLARATRKAEADRAGDPFPRRIL